MGFLTGLFQQTTPELQVTTAVVDADTNVEPGYLYRVTGSDGTVTISLRPHSRADVAGKRVAVKVFDGVLGRLTVAVPAGQQIEDSDGAIAATAVFDDPAVGLYREWLCDSEGTWFLVSRVDPE